MPDLRGRARIIEEGERADHVMVILGGQAEIRVEENGSERVVAVRGLGQLVGERASLTINVRSECLTSCGSAPVTARA